MQVDVAELIEKLVGARDAVQREALDELTSATRAHFEELLFDQRVSGNEKTAAILSVLMPTVPAPALAAWIGVALPPGAHVLAATEQLFREAAEC